MQDEVLTIHTDGGSRGNPGPAACAYVAELGGKIVSKGSKFLGTTTNNVAEYNGVLLALSWLSKMDDSIKPGKVVFYLDSELVVKQINGIYKIKKSDLIALNIEIKKLIEKIHLEIFFNNIPREQNKTADFLLNKELDLH